MDNGAVNRKQRMPPRPPSPSAFSSEDGSQILIPPSFSSLFVPPGRLKPALGAREMAARYELCEDMAQLLTEQAAQQQFQLGITEDLALDRCLQGLLSTPDVVSEAEARWVVCRLAELLNWPLPAWALTPKEGS